MTVIGLVLYDISKSVLSNCLTLKAPVITVADNILFFFPRKFDLTDESHEMARLIFSQKKNQNVVCYSNFNHYYSLG